MISSVAEEVEVPYLVCELYCVQGVVDVLTSVRWKCHQDAVVEISEHGIVIIVEETACLQAKVYLQREAASLKEAIDDREWPGSNIQINLMSSPQSVAFRGEGLGDLQIDINYYAYTDLLVAFSCDRQISHRYKYKFLPATTSNSPSVVIRDNRGSKFTIGRSGMLKFSTLSRLQNPVLRTLAMILLGISNPAALLTLNFSSSLR